MKKTFYLISLSFILQSCLSVKKTVDFESISLVNPSNEIKSTLNAIKKDTISISLSGELNEFVFKDSLSNGDIVIVENKKENKIAINLNDINISSGHSKDTTWVKPYGKDASINIKNPINLQYNRLRAKLKDVLIDTEKKTATLLLKASIFSIFSKNPKKIEPTISGIAEAIDEIDLSGELDLINFTKNLDKILIKKGDLAPRWSQDAYWKGGTKIISVSGNTITMSTRLRAEAWADGGWLGKHRLWRQTSQTTLKIKIRVDNYGKAIISVESFNFKHFPGAIEKKIRPSINDALKKYGLDLNPKGLNTRFKKLKFEKIDSKSLKIDFSAELD